MPINCFTDDCKILNKASFDLSISAMITIGTAQGSGGQLISSWGGM